MNYKPILIVPGDPDSIFFEIFFKTLKKKQTNSPIILITSLSLFRKYINKYNAKVKLCEIQASELYKQNLNFINLQKKNKFTKSYMNSLVHHEFGLNHKPFLFPSMNVSKFRQNDINYWLEQWINFYNFIKEAKLKENRNLIFINYKELCENTNNELQRIAKFIGKDVFENIGSKFFSLKQHETKEFAFDISIKKKSLEIYNYLKN